MKAEKGAVGANAQRQREGGHGCEPRILREDPKSLADFLKEHSRVDAAGRPKVQVVREKPSRSAGVLNHEPLSAPIRDDFRSVEIALRIRGHVVHDVELAGLRASHANRSDLRHRRTIEDHDPHRPGIHDVQELLLRVG